MAVLAGLLAPPATAAVPVGETFAPDTAYSSGANTFLQGGSPGGQYAIPSSGVITSWSFQANAGPPAQLRLKVARNMGGFSFRIMGQSAIEAPIQNQLGVFPTRIAVQAGDVLGIYTSGGFNTMRGLPAGTGYDLYSVAGDQVVGTTGSYAVSINPTYQLDLAATLEADADNDGFGDETQDGCPADPASQAPCPDTSAPDTLITLAPKSKTKKKQARFEFSSSEAGASFECVLDGGPFEPCNSPKIIKVSKGEHNFQVRARDAAGNADGTPATLDWKVKKKKKK